MTSKECIAMAMTYAGLDELRKCFLSEVTNNAEMDAIQKFVIFFKAVINEIAIGYVRLTKSVEVNHKGGVLAYKDIGDKLYEVISVKSGGRRIYPERTAEGLVLSKGKYTVRYAFLPNSQLNSELPFGTGVTGECVAYGVAAEYFLTMGMAEEAEAFDQKFRAALKGRRVAGNLKVGSWDSCSL